MNQAWVHKLKNRLKEGDILFISIPHFLYKAIEKGTQSPTSHVGIAIKVDNQWMVAESKVPFSCISTLADFVTRSDNNWLSVKRYKGDLNAQQIQKIKQTCHQHLGRLYNFGFIFDSNQQFCSKFVYQVFRQATGIKVGEVESFSALLTKSPDGLTLFWRLWFCGFVPLNANTITPYSQWVDPKFSEVLFNA